MKKVNRDTNFSRFSNNAKLSLRNASLIADNTNNGVVEPEHILLGVILNEESIGSKIMKSMGVNTFGIIKKIVKRKTLDITKDITLPKNMEFSINTQDCIRRAYDWSQKYSHVYVGTEHLVLGVLSGEYSFLKDILEFGLDIKGFQKQLSEYATYPVGVLAKPDISKMGIGGENMLDILGEDLVDMARQGLLDPVIGREQELNTLIKILSRRKKNNPVIVGEAGVGKTVLVEGLAQRIADGKVPPSIRNMRIISLDVPSIMAGSKMRGDLEEKVLDIVSEVIQSRNTILFIDEIHTILTSSILSGNSEIASVLKPALLKDDFRCIGATTTDEYTGYFENDNALVRRFQPVFLKESSIEDSISILKNLKGILEAHHSIKISEEAVESAVRLSDRYVSDRYLPDKAIDLLDEASAMKRISIEGQFGILSNLENKLKSILIAKESYIVKGDMEEARRLKRQEIQLKNNIEKLEKECSRSKRSKGSEVSVEDVRNVISEWTGIPLSTLGSKEKNSLIKLEKDLKKNIIGQDEAVSLVASAIKRARTGVSDIDRPWASFLFLGPTGVGKTELAKVLASNLFGNEDRLIQIDMSELMEVHSVSKLIGSPPGYIGYQEGGFLTEKVRRNPHCVILFDEIEKAHSDVLNILLQILEYGHLTDGKGKRVNFKNTIVILTSNIGAEKISQSKVLGFSRGKKVYSSMRSDLLLELRKELRPELLNRIDDIVIFRSLDKRDAKKVVELLLDDLNSRLSLQDVHVSLSKRLISYIVKSGFSDEYGARPLRRALLDTVENSVAEYLLRKEKGGDINLDIVNGKVVIL